VSEPVVSEYEQAVAHLQGLLASHALLVSCRLRLQIANRRVERETTDAAFAEVQSAAAALEEALVAGRVAFMRYGFGLGLVEPMPCPHRNEAGSGRANDSEPANPPEDGHH
jgi:hypothetical protein